MRMTKRVPRCQKEQSAAEVLALLGRTTWDDAHHIYVVDKEDRLEGIVALPDLVSAHPGNLIGTLAKPPSATLQPHQDQEASIFIAVKNNLDAVPVIDEQQRLLGVVTAKAIIGVMHQEHIEDSLLSVGLRGKKTDIVRLANQRLNLVLASRTPWLLIGAILGVGLGFVASLFEHSLERAIALAYFIPVVAYVADSVGTQSEAITVRALSMLKLNYKKYLFREMLTGLLIGIILGALCGAGAFIISMSLEIGLVVALSLVASCTLAALIASSIPIFFKHIGKDPALGSGPLSTILQDLASIVIYFICATIILRF